MTTRLRAPPPEITSSASPPASGVQRSSARAIVSAVSAVAVATASLSEPPACRTRPIRRSANSIPNRSRPVLLGGGSAKYGSASSESSTRWSGLPRRARALPARGHVARAEVAHHPHTHALRDHRRIAELQCRATGLVPDRLAMRGDERQVARRRPAAREELQDRAREAFA